MASSSLQGDSIKSPEKATLELNNEDTEFLNKKSTRESTNTTESHRPRPNVPSISYFRIDVHSFFSDRNEVVSKALSDCQRDLLSSSEEDSLLGAWLLTEISIWDTEKERIVLLTKTSLYSIKYDLISMRILEYTKALLDEVDTVVAGELVYPSSSLLPRLNGLAEGVSSLFNNAIRQEWSTFTNIPNNSEFEPRSRNMFGIRIMWNKGQPLPLEKKWNPFAKDIPMVTFTSHPLFWHKGSELEKAKYNVDELNRLLQELLPSQCLKIQSQIIIENYVGIGSLIHNRTGLGFFKIRGKVSF